MPTGKFSATTLELDAPTYLSLAEAAEKYDLSEEAVVHLIQAGQLQAARLSSGEVLVAADNGRYKTKAEIINQEFAHLRDQIISASEASRKYSKIYDVKIPHQNFSRWAEAGYIEVRKRGYRLQLNEADVAYCARTYAEKYKEYEGRIRGVPLFDEHGNPYQLKYEEIAEQRLRSL